MAFRDYQQAAIDSLFDYFRARPNATKANPVVAMPTGTGKSWVIGGFTHQALEMFPATRMLMATHVKELIAQNAKALLKIDPSLPLGIYSAGLNQKDYMQPIIYGGVKSIVNNLEAFGRRDLLLVDEGHLINPKAATSYRVLIDHFTKLNPFFRVIMFTATPYRMGQGLLTEDIDEKRPAIASDICFDITDVESFNRLIVEGYLSPLVSFRRDVGIDLSSVKISASGEFMEGAAAAAVDHEAITRKAVQECVAYASQRWSWLLFASSVQHAENIVRMLWQHGIAAAAIHSDLPDGEREARLKAFRRGQLRCLVNMNVLTTGFDFPPIDFIGMLRPTRSTGLWVQMLGRGTRPYDFRTFDDPEVAAFFRFVKQNCLVLDFAGNARSLGPINDPKIPQRKGKGPGGLPPVKDCTARHVDPVTKLRTGPLCGCENHISARFCYNCGAEFQFEVKISGTSFSDEVLSTDGPKVEWFDVDRVFYLEGESKKYNCKIIRVEYHCGPMRFSEFAWFGNPKLPMVSKTKQWWKRRTAMDFPETHEEAVPLLDLLKKPNKIKVWTNRKPYPEIMTSEFDAWQQSENLAGQNSALPWVFGLNSNSNVQT